LEKKGPKIEEISKMKEPIGKKLGGNEYKKGEVAARANMGLASLYIQSDMNHLEALEKLETAWNFIRETCDDKKEIKKRESIYSDLMDLIGWTLFKINAYNGICLKKITIKDATIEDALIENAMICNAEILRNAKIAKCRLQNANIRWIKIKNCSIDEIEYAVANKLLKESCALSSITDAAKNSESIQIQNTSDTRNCFNLRGAVVENIYICQAEIKKLIINKKNYIQDVCNTNEAIIENSSIDEDSIEYAELGQATLRSARIKEAAIENVIFKNCNCIALDMPIRLLEDAVCRRPDTEKYLHLALSWESKLRLESHDDREKKTIQERIMTYVQHASDLDADKQHDKKIEELRKRIVGSQPKETEDEKEKDSATTSISRNIEGNATVKLTLSQKAEDDHKSKKLDTSTTA
jgi:uncharacterized protein YjbI with pentapeptide repeats